MKESILQLKRRLTPLSRPYANGVTPWWGDILFWWQIKSRFHSCFMIQPIERQKNDKIQRWRIELIGFKYDIIYRAGAVYLELVVLSMTLTFSNFMKTSVIQGIPGLRTLSKWRTFHIHWTMFVVWHQNSLFAWKWNPNFVNHQYHTQ